MRQDTLEMQTIAVATVFANADDWVCRAIHESGIEIPEDFADMFAARVDPSRCKRVDIKNAAEVAQHMERLEKAREWFYTNVPNSVLSIHHTFTNMPIR
jgi:hypothetical protein